MENRFFWVGNHPGLDFINTHAVDADGRPLELLGSWTDLVAWVAEAGLVEVDVIDRCASIPDRQARRVLDWTRTLRSHARRVLLSSGHRRRAETQLARTLAAVPVRLTFPRDARLGVPLTTTELSDRLRLALAVTVLDATGLDRSRIRVCGSDRCVLAYYDTSKNGSRRWCAMAACGNRAKAAAHYRRAKVHRSHGR